MDLYTIINYRRSSPLFYLQVWSHPHWKQRSASWHVSCGTEGSIMGVSKAGRPCAGTNWRRNLGQQSAGTCGPFQHQINSIKILYILIYIYINIYNVSWGCGRSKLWDPFEHRSRWQMDVDFLECGIIGFHPCQYQICHESPTFPGRRLLSFWGFIVIMLSGLDNQTWCPL